MVDSLSYSPSYTIWFYARFLINKARF